MKCSFAIIIVFFIQFAGGRFNSFADWSTECDKCLKELRPLYGFNIMVNILTFPHPTRKAFHNNNESKLLKASPQRINYCYMHNTPHQNVCTYSPNHYPICSYGINACSTEKADGFSFQI